jgi:HSP20 family protein
MNYPARRSGWDPRSDLASLRSDMSRLLGALSGGRAGDSWFGDVDTDQDDNAWTVTARLPGVAPDEVAIDVEGRELTIRAKSDATDEGETATTRRRSAFNYQLTIPGDVDPDQIDATMDHGLLTVRLPRTGRAQRRSITINRAATPTATPTGAASNAGSASASQTAPKPTPSDEHADTGHRNMATGEARPAPTPSRFDQSSELSSLD